MSFTPHLLPQTLRIGILCVQLLLAGVLAGILLVSWSDLQTQSRWLLAFGAFLLIGRAARHVSHLLQPTL